MENGLVHLYFFAFSICFCNCYFVLLFAWKTKNANGQVHVFHVSPFLTFLFFPFILLPVFFSFEVLLLILHLFSFFCIFQV